ncbi:tubulin polyglutamylase TTLL4 isoform X3 [Anoplophora glabripennis]|uniref:tubulin polyglutamylase TTLL4 isoform X3 n=1 Tax=Anoplophora glabripennis TaxID=217634 RepID=UPI0008759AEB|nr:tubulin polyglutamylase TTLL4 isoform X3 [Anoplophora glabripennis]
MKLDIIETENDYSGTDSENEVTVDEELNSISESLTDESNREPSGVSAPLPRDSGSGDSLSWPIRPSLFPNIPPYIHFNTHDSEIEFKVPNGRKFFKWKLSTITPVVVRKTLTNSGFTLVRSEFTRESNQWLGTWGKHMKSPMFKTLKETQKLNHFPGTFQLGRKDRLWRNFQKMINKFGHKEFGFLPHTYVLPQELKLLKQNWEFKNGNGGEMWIIKPPASARGVGIKVINKWSQLPKKTSLVVQKYISNPYLINGSKFDLRLYVLVTSFNPLRIYLYPDGLARFASAKYSDDAKDLKDRYMHLTNYSINKLSSQYTANEDANACQGHKWTVSKLMEYLEDTGVDTKALWKNLEQLVIKTIIACEDPITQLCEENMNNHYNCYELFGVDVLLDSKLKPWLLEVNISPSLHSASPLDAHVKGPLVKNLFDMAQFHLPPKLGQTVQQSPQCFEPKLYTINLTKKEKHKHISFSQFEHRDDYLYDILRDLTGDDVRHLVRAEDEYVVRGKFERIFPSAHTYKYLNFMETRYYNRLFDAWETKYAGRREDGITLLQTLCAQKVHLKVAPPSTLHKNSQSMIPSDMNVLQSKEGLNHHLEEIMQKASIINDISTTN